jgi:hypothetical protein
MLVHVNEVFKDRAGPSLHMRLHVDRIHVLVAIEGEWKAPDVFPAVAIGEIVPERFLLEDE